MGKVKMQYKTTGMQAAVTRPRSKSRYGGDSSPDPHFKSRFGGDSSPDPHFAGTPDMFLPRVPPHAPVTIGRQKHVGPAKCLSCDCLPLRPPLATASRLGRTLLRPCFARLLASLVGEPDGFAAGASRPRGIPPSTKSTLESTGRPGGCRTPSAPQRLCVGPNMLVCGPPGVRPLPEFRP